MAASSCLLTHQWHMPLSTFGATEIPTVPPTHPTKSFWDTSNTHVSRKSQKMYLFDEGAAGVCVAATGSATPLPVQSRVM
jgi:hypothetical protein